MTASQAPWPTGTLTVLVRQIRLEGRGIYSYELRADDNAELPPFEAGAHIDVHVAPHLVRQYSLCNDPGERHRYVIAVLRDEGGRGGSKSLHDQVRVEDKIQISAPRNHFALKGSPARAILLAGGIGVTPLKSMAHQLARDGTSYELHYCAKDMFFAAFQEELAQLSDGGSHHHFHFDRGNPANGLDIATLLRDVQPETHVYYCGPSGFMAACAAATAHWPEGQVHCEHFKAPTPQAGAAVAQVGSFDVQVASTGQTARVAPDRSIVDVLSEMGVAVETSCQSGLCGSCKVRYLAGVPEHNDCILDEQERVEYLTVCVSRAQSDLLVLDL